MTSPGKALWLPDEPAYDYPHGPPTRWSRPWSSPLVTALTALGSMLVGFLLVAGLSAGRTSALEQDARKAELIALINARQNHTAELSARLEELRDRVAAAEADIATGIPNLAAYLSEVEQAAGLTRVRGPGLRVTFTDADTACSARQEDCRIHDTDLQLAVNALFAAGAEALAVNGERVISTTAVRQAGNQILVNYRVLSPPYVVEAIGNPDRLELDFSRSEIARQFAVWTDVYGLGLSTEVVGELDLVGYRGSLRLRSAQPAGALPDTPTIGSDQG